MNPYREMEPTELPAKPIELCVGECPCDNCGHACSKHYFFNSEFIDCLALGTQNESLIAGKMVKHQPKAICRCPKFKRKDPR